MKPSSAKCLPFFVLERDPSTYLHTIREHRRVHSHIHTHIYIYAHTHTHPSIHICARARERASPRDPQRERVSHSLLGEIAFRGRVGHSCLSGAFKMTMIRDTSRVASASSSAFFAPRSLTLFRSVPLPPLALLLPPPPFVVLGLHRPSSRHWLLVLLNHYKPPSTLNRKQALVHGRTSTRKHLNPTIKSHLRAERMAGLSARRI